MLSGGIARIVRITARAAVKDRRPPQAASASALVLDGEHGVIGSRCQATLPLSFLVRRAPPCSE
jgi:hypothetical protein